ncbi:hypothetical protein LINPERPRIM_LOCUS22554 [Linum perenne]
MRCCQFRVSALTHSLGLLLANRQDRWIQDSETDNVQNMVSNNTKQE